MWNDGEKDRSDYDPDYEFSFAIENDFFEWYEYKIDYTNYKYN